MRLILSATAGLAFVAGVTQSMTFGTVHSLAAASIEAAEGGLFGDLPQILAAARKDELVPVYVVMRRQANPGDIQAARLVPDKEERREMVTDILKQVAAETQADVLAVLEAAQRRGDVGEFIRPLWIANAIGFAATPQVIRQIAGRADVEYVAYDTPIGPEVFPVLPPVEGDPGQGAGPLAAIECGVQIMRAPQVWNELDITGRDVVVGVIDTGCCITHPDLANQIWVNPGEVPNNNIDDDSNGFVDDVNGWSFDNNGSSRIITDNFGHGTHVSGTVAGDGTNGQQTGMAPDAKIMTLKFWNSFSGELSVWNGTQYGVDNGAQVLTASLGWPHSVNPNRAMWRQVCENAMNAGVVVVYAAGNEGACCRPFDAVRTPGDVPDMITVGATDCNDNIAGFSSRGPITWQNVNPYNDHPHPPGKLKPTISAPGVDTLSTSNNCSSYTTMSGTSMATPHVAGAIALILEANPDLDHWEVKQILKDTSVDRGASGPDNDYGAGRVDAYEAVVAALSSGATPATLTSMSIVRGSLLGGIVDDLNDSDDVRVRVESGFGPAFTDLHSMVVRVQAETNLSTPSTLDVLLEARLNHAGGGLARVSLHNWNSGQFDPVANWALSNADTSNSVEGIAAANYARKGSPDIEVQLTTVVVVPVFSFQYNTLIDQLVVTVH